MSATLLGPLSRKPLQIDALALVGRSLLDQRSGLIER